ncbi:hypothetical protein [Paenibacillus sp. MBLB4367]|uniref:hypothetical protein n=1 Tax=Paenibacillus sp. MBLB4367 TaxID=3384767 RepID=UPI00390811D3
MKDRHLSEQSTIYNYTLLKKIPYSKYYKTMYAGALLLGTTLLFTTFGIRAVVSILIAYVIVQLLHVLLLRQLLSLAHANNRNVWKIKLDFPSVGYLPDGFIAASLFKRLHLHLFVVGTAVIAMTYLWVEPVYFYSLLIMHTWVLFPRFLHLWRFRKLNKTGLIKCNPLDSSFYIA